MNILLDDLMQNFQPKVTQNGYPKSKERTSLDRNFQIEKQSVWNI